MRKLNNIQGLKKKTKDTPRKYLTIKNIHLIKAYMMYREPCLAGKSQPK